jgi:hypothetical protein
VIRRGAEWDLFHGCCGEWPLAQKSSEDKKGARERGRRECAVAGSSRLLRLLRFSAVAATLESAAHWMHQHRTRNSGLQLRARPG